ncbi:MAG: TatD family hydrolase [Deltaproteobacteria bacterium]|jgi:TatD DNase family protein|nr:TatD family hydrolase [Deltaproteobacteria bacterium]
MPRTLPLIDAHCHLFLPDYAADLEPTISRAKAAGVIAIVNAGLDAASSSLALDLADQYAGLFATVGWHPHEADQYLDKNLLELESLAKRAKNVAIGEIGLDFYRQNSSKEAQVKVFNQLLALAASLKLPVVIHSRAAFKETTAILKAHRKTLGPILMHCFTGTVTEAEAYLALDCHFSIPGVLSFPKAHDLKKALSVIPKERLLIETDAPYLAPVPHRGRRNEPAFLSSTLLALAETIDLEPTKTALLTTQNASRFFNLPLDDLKEPS